MFLKRRDGSAQGFCDGCMIGTARRLAESRTTKDTHRQARQGGKPLQALHGGIGNIAERKSLHNANL